MDIKVKIYDLKTEKEDFEDAMKEGRDRPISGNLINCYRDYAFIAIEAGQISEKIIIKVPLYRVRWYN